MGNLRLRGTFTAIVTPFRDDRGSTVDEEALDAIVDAQIEGGVQGIVPCGTTGESPTLSDDEQRDVIARVVARTKGRVAVLAGTGSNATHEAVARSVAAERAGADAVMVVVPYYNKPSQAGLERHFVTVAKAVSCPVVVYNIPGRSVVDLSSDTLARICDAAPNVVGVKEATGNVLRAQDLVRRFGSRLDVLSGDDALTLAMMAVGATGVISVTSNVLPRAVAEVVNLALEGRFDVARTKNARLLPVHEAMFVDANPGPAKFALARRGILQNVLRAPMTTLSEAHGRVVAIALDAFERGAER
ncbi:MAG: 4-hydroxy-tetrahydrodipicolinate synthase [Polyangiaceae bacterium]